MSAARFKEVTFKVSHLLYQYMKCFEEPMFIDYISNMPLLFQGRSDRREGLFALDRCTNVFIGATVAASMSLFPCEVPCWQGAHYQASTTPNSCAEILKHHRFPNHALRSIVWRCVNAASRSSGFPIGFPGLPRKLKSLGTRGRL